MLEGHGGRIREIDRVPSQKFIHTSYQFHIISYPHKIDSIFLCPHTRYTCCTAKTVINFLYPYIAIKKVSFYALFFVLRFATCTHSSQSASCDPMRALLSTSTFFVIISTLTKMVEFYVFQIKIINGRFYQSNLK